MHLIRFKFIIQGDLQTSGHLYVRLFGQKSTLCLKVKTELTERIIDTETKNSMFKNVDRELGTT